MLAKNKRFLILSAASLSLLLIPFVAMQFTQEVQWKTGDFIVAGILLLGVTLMIDLLMRKVRSKSKKWLLMLSCAALFILVWLELAVGIFGTPFAGS
ncbi:MAG: hypothetical protein EP338_07330 [Bacteroidetes bacterium]|nr:MAG: hypothetical protein EP338_07330 [Bacteroidota bacterium]